LKVFVAAVSGETQYVDGMISLHQLKLREGDDCVVESRERGETARTLLIDMFMDRKEFDAVLMLDLDMRHPWNLLETLREDMAGGDLDMVSAHYFRRQVYPQPVFSIASLISRDDSWPYASMLDIPETGLIEIASTGMGCVLIRRRVMEALFHVLPVNDSPVATRPMPAYSGGSFHKWGSDFAFFTMARSLGFRLWLDAGVESSHACTVWLDRALYNILRPHSDYSHYHNNLWRQNKELYGMNEKAIEARRIQLLSRANEINGRAQQLRKTREDIGKEIEKLHQEFMNIGARVAEIDAWTKGGDKGQVTAPADLPKFKDEAEQAHSTELREGLMGKSEKQVHEMRAEAVYSSEAMELANAANARPHNGQ
jgi:hypothetical protein